MGEALTGAAAAAKVIVGPDGQPLSPVLFKREAIFKYEPDKSAYEAWKLDDGSDVPNPPLEFLKRAEAGQVRIEAHLLTTEGRRIKVDLSESDARHLVGEEKSAGASLSEIATRLQRENIIERGKQLRESGAVDPKTKRPIAEDGPYNSDDFGTGYQTGWYTGMGGYQADMYLPLGNGPYNRQLYLHDMWSMQAKAFWARHHDPVAKAGLEIVSEFVLGGGYSVKFADPLCQKEWDTFFELNHLELKLPEWLLDGQMDGNMFHRFFPQKTRPPDIALIDATTFWEIFTEPENVEKPVLYWQQYHEPYTIFTVNGPDGKQLQGYQYIIRQIPADEIIHTKFNASSSEKFGRSDLFPVLGWLKRLRDYYDAETIKAMIQAAFAWHFKLTGSGADVTAVQQFQATNPPPSLATPGQAFYTNDAVEINALQADKINTTTGGIGIGDGLLSIIAVGLRLAKDYFGVTSRGSLGSDPSKTATEPTIKHAKARQKLMRHLLTRMAEKVIKIAQDERRLPRTTVKAIGTKDIIAALRRGDLSDAFNLLRKALGGGQIVPLDTSVAITFPDIIREDRSALLKDTESAEASNLISKRQRAEIIARSLDIDGYSFDETQDEIDEEMKRETTSVIARTGEQVKKGEPSPFAIAWPPGAVPNMNAPGAQPPSTNGASESAKKLLTIELGDR